MNMNRPHPPPQKKKNPAEQQQRREPQRQGIRPVRSAPAPVPAPGGATPAAPALGDVDEDGESEGTRAGTSDEPKY